MKDWKQTMMAVLVMLLFVNFGMAQEQFDPGVPQKSLAERLEEAQNDPIEPQDRNEILRKMKELNERLSNPTDPNSAVKPSTNVVMRPVTVSKHGSVASRTLTSSGKKPSSRLRNAPASSKQLFPSSRVSLEEMEGQIKLLRDEAALLNRKAEWLHKMLSDLKGDKRIVGKAK